MSGYHNVVLPPSYSAGSTYSVGFDTRVTELENGQEERLVRYAPGGRRRYQLHRGIDNVTGIHTLYKFFIARAGAANSFKFFDVQDHSTAFANTAPPYSADPPTEVDIDLQFVSGTTYQCVTGYDDGQGFTVVRAVTKILEATYDARFTVNGVEVFGLDFTLDTETGLVTFDPALAPINSATWGGEYYTVVRFSQATDEAFRVVMPAAPGTQELPSIELIEVISPALVSQDFHYGGAHGFETAVSVSLTEVNGRVQSVDPTVGSLAVRLPQILDMPQGGPLFVIHNASVVNSLDVEEADLTVLKTLLPGEVVEVYVGQAPDDVIISKFWVLIP